MKQLIERPVYGTAGKRGHEGFASSVDKIVNEPRRTAAGNAALASTQPRGKFYVGSAAVLLLVVLVGFGPTFYLRAAFGAPELSWRGGVPWCRGGCLSMG